MKKVFRRLLIVFFAAALLSLIAIVSTYFLVSPSLPEVDTLRDVQLQVPLRVYTQDGKLIGLFGEMRRIPVSIQEVPDDMRNAFIAGEDARFYEHPGVDYQGITRAAFTLATTGEKTVGGSTITQQLARNFFLTSEKTFTRKIKEIFLALRIEEHLSKDEILELYLNKIFLGYRAYGVGAAAEVYYGKSIGELTLAQSAMIAALPKAPSRINPINQPERAIERRDYVLNRMLELGYIDQQRHDEAVREKDMAYYHGATAELSAPYLAEMVRVRALELLGLEAYTGGYVVVTTIDGALQSAANRAVEMGLVDYDRRHGYRGPEARIDINDRSSPDDWDEVLAPYRPVSGLAPGVVTEVSAEAALVYLGNGQSIALELEDWAAPFISRDRTGKKPQSLLDVLAAGDIIRARLDDEGRWRLAQVPEVEAALVSMDPRTGEIRALVGGFDFTRSKFNRVVQGKRQPGSSFKPFIYAAALERGFTTASLVNDAPIVFDDPELERTWKPENFSEKFYGPTRLREALVNSRNLVSIRLLRDIGIEYGREYITRFGFELADLPPNLTLALGSPSLTPLSMARGYAVFANSGYLVTPDFVREIRTDLGEVLYQNRPPTFCDDCLTGTGDTPLPTSAIGSGGGTEGAAISGAGSEAGIDALGKAGQTATAPELRPLTIEEEPVEGLLLDGERHGPIQISEPAVNYAHRVVSPQNAYLVRSMMMDVIRRGTGARVMELGRNDLAGKTGTTNEQRDAWFSGYNDHLVTSVWVGFDNSDPLGRNELGGRAALPIWMEFMRVALQGVEDTPPVMPQGLAQAKIDPESGLIATLDNSSAIMEIFEAGKMPPMEAESGGENEDVSTAEDPYEVY